MRRLMKIAASDVTLTGTSSHVSANIRRMDMSFGRMSPLFNVSDMKTFGQKDSFERSDVDSNVLSIGLEDLYMGAAAGKKSIPTAVSEPKTDEEELDTFETFQMKLLEMILQLAENLGMGDSKMARSARERIETMRGGDASFYRQSMSYAVISYEAESAAFQGMGRAMTEDGRVIDFNLQFGMSREFMEYTKISASAVTGVLMDPLIINVGSDIAHISDHAFYFDLDCDGKKENVRLPEAGTGFLVDDRNGDGVINDGSELMGALTGDGFDELREYDQDGNGWIDENDTASWNALKVWIRDADGRDRLLTLKEADVGAIYLGEVKTEYSDYSDDSFGGSLNGVIRSTGIFLHEKSGMAGTIQHVDLAVN
jgi:hypothetical protein